MKRILASSLGSAGLASFLMTASLFAQVEATNSAKKKNDREKPTEPSSLVRLSKTGEVWVDLKKKIVVVGGRICLRQGQLEMFACPEGTKEHESIVALKCKASEIHAGLLAIGAKPGKPVQYDPKYKPATGDVIEVFVVWSDKAKKQHRIRAQEMIRHVATRQPMAHQWVFAGSGFWKDPDNGDRHYLAEGGEAICVSNFSSAMMDLDVESSQQAGNLLFDVFTEQVPELGTKVQLHLLRKADKGEANTNPKS